MRAGSRWLWAVVLVGAGACDGDAFDGRRDARPDVPGGEVASDDGPSARTDAAADGTGDGSVSGDTSTDAGGEGSSPAPDAADAADARDAAGEMAPDAGDAGSAPDAGDAGSAPDAGADVGPMVGSCPGDAGGPLMPAPRPAAGGAAPRVSLLDGTDPAGALVTLSGGSPASMVASDGSFAIPAAPDGTYALSISKGPWEETLPAVQKSGGSLLVVGAGGATSALGAVELQRAHRLLSGASDVIRYDTSSTAVAYVQYDAGGAGTARYVSLAGASATLATGFTFQALFVENGARVLVSKGANSSLTEGTPEVVDPITGARFPLGIHVALGTFFRLTPERVMFDWSSTSQNAGGMGLARLDVGDVVTVARRSNVWRRPRDSNAWLAMLNGTTGLQLIDVASGAAHTVLTSDFPYAFDLTPDGQRLVYSVIATYVVPTAGGTPVKLADTREYVLSPDGSMILVQPSISSPLQIIPVAGGPARTITDDVLTPSQGLNPFSSDGAFVFFQTINAFKVASTAALDVQIVTTQTNAFVATYVPARHMAYFVADNATNFSTRDLYRMPLDRSGPRVALATGIVSGLLKSPSGRYILYPVPGLPDGGSMLTLTDTTSEAVVPLAPGLFSRAVFSPDERWILFVDSEGWVRLGRTADGTTFRVALGGSPLSFSPSGTRAMFVANGVLATLPVEPCPVPTFVARDLDPNSPPRWVGDQAVAFFRANVPAPLGVASGFYLASIP